VAAPRSIRTHSSRSACRAAHSPRAAPRSSRSLKDRASLLVAAQAIAAGERRVALASTGNAGASMAAAGAALGLEVVLFVPGSAPRAKLLQSLLYGARVVPVQGTYDDAFGLSIAYTEARGGVNRTTAFNPFTIEGKKTVSLEIWNRIGGRMPDVVYVPTGDGVILGGVHKGFVDLVAAGLAERLPVLVAVQASGSNAIVRSFHEGRQVVLARTSTIADSLAVCSPANGEMALRCLAATGGRALEVDDAAIGRAQLELCRGSGIFVEPSSAAAWAGFLADRANLERDAVVVVLLTGTGFKDVKAAEAHVAMVEPCEPRLGPALELLEREYGVR
jgi:threonine synthase